MFDPVRSPSRPEICWGSAEGYKVGPYYHYNAPYGPRARYVPKALHLYLYLDPAYGLSDPPWYLHLAPPDPLYYERDVGFVGPYKDMVLAIPHHQTKSTTGNESALQQ